MISALVWVPRGASKNKENEVEDFMLNTCIPGEDENLMQESDGSSHSSSVSVDEVLASDLSSLTHKDATQADLEWDQQDEEEKEDLKYRETDAVVICGLTENEVSSLVFYVVEDTEDGPNLYPHHDLVLSSFPLSLAWLNVSSLDRWNCKSCVAVGSLIPQIEIYDASAIDELEPIAVLGETRISKLTCSSTEKRTKRRPKKAVDSEYHSDSVLSLSWNKNEEKYLASGSADCTIRCWDIASCKSIRTWSHHEKEVQSVCWHEKESTLLLSGSFDQTVSLLDTRVDQNIPSFRLSVSCDVEAVCWFPNSWGSDASFKFLVTLENGTMEVFDSRMISSENDNSLPLWTCKAHEKAVSACTFSTHFKGMLVTGSLDERIRLWDCKEDRPQLVKEWNNTIGVGAIFATQFSKDEETSNWLALSGSKGKLKLLDILCVGDSLVQHFPECSRFGSLLYRSNDNPSLVGVYSDDESHSSCD